MIASEVCRVCGKRGKRPCPATGGLICPACCGSQRGSKLACPPECEFYPLGTASQKLWQEVNQSWATKSMRFLDERLGSKTMADIMQRFLPGRTLNRKDALAAFFPSVYHGLLAHRDAQGKTMADVWEAQDWAGLNNDEKVMMRYRRHSFVTVLEVQRTVAGQYLECLDLLDPDSKPFRVLDLASAPAVARFTKMLVWLTHYPHFSRIGAIWFAIPEGLWPAWLEYTQQQWHEEQKTRPDLTRRQYLAEHMWQNEPLLEALAEQAKRRMLESIAVFHCLAEYRLNVPMDNVRARLESRPDFVAEQPKPTVGFQTPPHFYVWQAKGESEGLEKNLPEFLRQTRGVQQLGLGHLRLYPDRLVLETFAKAIHQAGRELLERLLGEHAQFVNESIVDMARKVEEREALWPVEREPQAEPSRASQAPLTEADRQRLRDAHYQQYQKLLDEPSKALNGSSPRAAALDPALRPKLVDWLKSHLHQIDLVNLRHGLDLNLDAVLDELGVPELKG